MSLFDPTILALYIIAKQNVLSLFWVAALPTVFVFRIHIRVILLAGREQVLSVAGPLDLVLCAHAVGPRCHLWNLYFLCSASIVSCAY